MRAAIYARYSSDSQREESIEIQIERCSACIDSHNWELVEIYTDYAMSGTNDERPSFLRCIDDGVAHKYDVLVIYKLDRFARNMEVSRHYKDRLRKAGIKIWSVREGELEDTPDGFLREAVGEMFAEYYSRNLAVLIKDGVRKNAEKCLVSGRRLYGYKTGSDGRYEIDENEAEVVRTIFSMYLGGATSNEIANTLNSRGLKTVRGRDWYANYITKILRYDYYTGLYKYAGTVVEGGMPAIIDKSDFMEVQYMLDSKKASKRRAVNNDYLLSSKLTCLRCGKPMFGQSGTGRSGNKYTYYACASKSGNCGLRINSNLLEDAVINSVKDMLDDRGTIDAMVASVLNYANSLPDATEQYTQERVSLVQRRDNLVESIAQGIPVDTVREPLLECENRIKELDLLIEREKFNREKLLSEEDVRSYMAKFVDKSDANNERGKLLVDTFINQVFVGEGVAAVVFAVGDDKPVPIEEIRELVKQKHPQLSDSEGVRVTCLWWRRITLERTIFYHNCTFVLVVNFS